MCGIAGLINFSLDDNALAQSVGCMNSAISHRGPNDNGVWLDEGCRLALGHARLSIVDLSSSGHQPMNSACGRYVIVYNGEVYNFQALALELRDKGFQFRGHSDTEVMLASISCWGLKNAVNSFVGMFAFALWDKKEECLYLVRDRLGIKPLYYRLTEGEFSFASELKAFTTLPGWQPEINPLAAFSMLQRSFVAGDQAIFKGIKKLLPGHIIKVKIKNGAIEYGQPEAYWSVESFAYRSPDLLDEFEAKGALGGLIQKVVSDRMVADVPLGCFLSGGIDSTLVTAAMQRQSSERIKTFSIGFADKQYNEADSARAIAEYLGTDHHELYIDEQAMLDVISRIPDVYDEPFADPSQLPTYILSELTKKHVTVALSGDGGDELCGGYTRHFEAARIERLLSTPRFLRKVGGGALSSLSVAAWDRLGGVIGGNQRLLGDKLHKLSRVMKSENSQQLYDIITSSGDLTAIWSASFPEYEKGTVLDRSTSLGEQFILRDMQRYLPDDILTKVDRASMAVSLETRVPLLDHRLIELSWRIPFDMKVKNGSGKWILRQILADWVPEPLWNRPKMGFSVPIGKWMKGSLKEWSEYYLLDCDAYTSHGLLDNKAVENLWREHLNGQGNHQYQLWNILMFHSWYDLWILNHNDTKQVTI